MRGPVGGARAKLGCHSQSGMQGAVWDATTNLRCMLHQAYYQVTYAAQCAVQYCCIAARSALVLRDIDGDVCSTGTANGKVDGYGNDFIFLPSGIIIYSIPNIFTKIGPGSALCSAGSIT